MNKLLLIIRDARIPLRGNSLPASPLVLLLLFEAQPVCSKVSHTPTLA